MNGLAALALRRHLVDRPDRLFRVEAPWLFRIVFGLVGLALLAATLDLWLSGTVIEAPRTAPGR